MVSSAPYENRLNEKKYHNLFNLIKTLEVIDKSWKSQRIIQRKDFLVVDLGFGLACTALVPSRSSWDSLFIIKI